MLFAQFQFLVGLCNVFHQIKVFCKLHIPDGMVSLSCVAAIVGPLPQIKVVLAEP